MNAEQAGRTTSRRTVLVIAIVLSAVVAWVVLVAHMVQEYQRN